MRLRQCYAATVGLRPDEAAAFKMLGQQAQVVTAPPLHLDNVPAQASEQEHAAAARICGQRRLRLGRQSVHASGQPDFGACRLAGHGKSRASNSANVAASTCLSRRSWA